MDFFHLGGDKKEQEDGEVPPLLCLTRGDLACEMTQLNILQIA